MNKFTSKVIKILTQKYQYCLLITKNSSKRLANFWCLKLRRTTMLRNFLNENIMGTFELELFFTVISLGFIFGGCYSFFISLFTVSRARDTKLENRELRSSRSSSLSSIPLSLFENRFLNTRLCDGSINSFLSPPNTSIP